MAFVRLGVVTMMCLISHGVAKCVNFVKDPTLSDTKSCYEGSVDSIPIKFYSVNKSLLRPINVSGLIANVNSAFKKSGLQFVAPDGNSVHALKTTAVIKSKDAQAIPMITGLDKKEKVVLIFFHPIDVGVEAMDCGIASRFKSLSATLSPDSRCWQTEKQLSSILIHELGHIFNLNHTHNEEDDREAELVDGSNCENSADNLCDTPADPDLFDKVSKECSYVAKDVDKNGEHFNKQVKKLISNYMSYAPFACQSSFTEKQSEILTQSATHSICK